MLKFAKERIEQISFNVTIVFNTDNHTIGLSDGRS